MVCPSRKRQWDIRKDSCNVLFGTSCFYGSNSDPQLIQALCFVFFSVWGLVVRKVCFCLNPKVRFPRDFIGESGGGA